MKRINVYLLLILNVFVCRAQTAFDKVYDGCCLAVSALSDGSGSQTDIRRAASLLKEANWVTFNLMQPDREKDVAIGKHLVFNENYFTDLADGHVVKRKAKEYYAENRSGNGVRLCTKVIKAGATVTYSFNFMGGNKLRVGAVAETNGLINLKVIAKRKGSSQQNIERKDNSNEYKGAPSRQIDVDLPKGQYIITLEITNKYNKDRSCAIIAN